MKLAVISDLHVGTKARAKDLCPTPPATPKKDRDAYNRKDDDYRQQFVDFVTKSNISADYLVLPGDLTNQALPREVEIASAFALQAADALQVPHERILFAPGNHDVDWTAFDPNDTTGVRWGQRYASLGHDNFHFRTLINRGHGDVLSPPHFIAWEFPDLLAVAYNSASHDTPTPQENVHHGLAAPEHLDAIRDYLASIGPKTARVRLFLVHHHVVEFTDPIPRTPDFSLMTNAEGLLSLLHECGFDLIIHGHTHHPRFDTHSTATYPHIPILCSGSFSVELDTRWAGTVDNLFHVITINGRSGTDNLITADVTSWTNNHARGWVPSEESVSGIHHIIPFGSYVMPADLDSLLEPIIGRRLAEHDLILWKHVVDECPQLEHLPVKSAEAAFTRLAKALGCTFFAPTAIHGLMLFKET